MKYKMGETPTPPLPWSIKHERLVDANGEEINIKSRNILAYLAVAANTAKLNGWCCSKCISSACIC